MIARGGQKLPNRSESAETEKELDCWVVMGRVTGWPDEKNWVLMDRNGRARIDFLDPTKSETDRVQPILISIIIINYYYYYYFLPKYIFFPRKR
jgi:hypothetical protein